MITKDEALAYHRDGRPGKLEVVATKSTLTARDLSLAYTPGVAEPCREIVRDPELLLDSDTDSASDDQSSNNP